jgi:hypothetical protein
MVEGPLEPPPPPELQAEKKKKIEFRQEVK